MRLEPTKYNISSKKLPSLANTSQVKNPQVQVAAACKRYIENIRAQRYYKLNVWKESQSRKYESHELNSTKIVKVFFR